jgi:hypothetical protein
MASETDTQRLCRLLGTAARKLVGIRGSIWSSYDSGPHIAKFVLECKDGIEQGTIGLAEKRELWGIFAPTCDWDDVVGDADLGDRIFSLLDKLYGKEF